MRKTLFCLVACLAVLTTACGDSDDDATTTTTEAKAADPGTADETTTTAPAEATTTTTEADAEGPDDVELSADGQAYADAIAEAMATEDDFATEDQARCIAGRWVSIVGADRLAAAGITVDDVAGDEVSTFGGVDMSEAEANSLYDAYGDCGVDVRGAMLAEMADDESLTADDRACLADAYSDEFLRGFMVRTLRSDPEDMEASMEMFAELLAPMEQCPGVMEAMEAEMGDLSEIDEPVGG